MERANGTQKALNLFNAALVTPTYYVYFTSTTIITSAVLFQGFKGTPTSIVTVVNGFLTICSGVVLLQLSKSAKDVPDAAVFAGDLDQIQTIAEQEQPETEPKADAIRGTAAIVRRLSSARMKMEYEEFKRLQEEKRAEQLEPVSENGAPLYEWDGLRRRRTTLGSNRSRSMTSTTPFPNLPPTPHPPLGWSHIPTEEELAEADRPVSPAISSLVGTIRNRARSVLLPGHPDFKGNADPSKSQSPLHPVQLTEIVVQAPKADEGYQALGQTYNSRGPRESRQDSTASGSSSARRVAFSRGRDVEGNETGDRLRGPTPPPHSARRQFSFNNIFRRHQTPDQHDGAHDRRPISSRGYSNPQMKEASEEERLGLVKGDSQKAYQSAPALPRYNEEEEEAYVDDKQARYGPSITHTPPRRGSDEKAAALKEDDEVTAYEQRRQRFKEKSRSGSRDDVPPPPPPHRQRSPPDRDNDGAFI